MMLDEPRDVGVILKHKHSLAQAEVPFSRRGGGFRPQPKRERANGMQKLCEFGRAAEAKRAGRGDTELQLSWRILTGFGLHFVWLADISKCYTSRGCPQKIPLGFRKSRLVEYRS